MWFILKNPGTSRFFKFLLCLHKFKAQRPLYPPGWRCSPSARDHSLWPQSSLPVDLPFFHPKKAPVGGWPKKKTDNFWINKKKGQQKKDGVTKKKLTALKINKHGKLTSTGTKLSSMTSWGLKKETVGQWLHKAHEAQVEIKFICELMQIVDDDDNYDDDDDDGGLWKRISPDLRTWSVELCQAPGRKGPFNNYCNML